VRQPAKAGQSCGLTECQVDAAEAALKIESNYIDR